MVKIVMHSNPLWDLSIYEGWRLYWSGLGETGDNILSVN